MNTAEIDDAYWKAVVATEVDCPLNTPYPVMCKRLEETKKASYLCIIEHCHQCLPPPLPVCETIGKRLICPCCWVTYNYQILSAFLDDAEHDGLTPQKEHELISLLKVGSK